MKPSRDELFDLYKSAIEEYRFEVKLNWDRMRYFVALNATLIGVGVGLFKLTGSHSTRESVLTGLFFVVAFLTSVLGMFAIRKGREYYLASVFKKTLIENLLGLNAKIEGYNSERATLALATTRGMTRVIEILENTDTWMNHSKIRRGSVVYYVMITLLLLGLVDLTCAVVAFLSAQPVPSFELVY